MKSSALVSGNWLVLTGILTLISSGVIHGQESLKVGSDTIVQKDLGDVIRKCTE